VGHESSCAVTSRIPSMQNYLKVASVLREINKTVPIDLIVHTKAMHQAFVRLDSMFAREAMTRGRVL
jgi:hypothetical protein